MKLKVCFLFVKSENDNQKNLMGTKQIFYSLFQKKIVTPPGNSRVYTKILGKNMDFQGDSAKRKWKIPGGSTSKKSISSTGGKFFSGKAQFRENVNQP